MHVYCVDCIHLQPIPCATETCEKCPCNGCFCFNPEDSSNINERPNYQPKKNV